MSETKIVVTWDELSDFLLTVMDSFNDTDLMTNNPSLTKKQFWNSLMGDCMKYSGDLLPIRTRNLLIKTVTKNFGIPEMVEIEEEEG